jgi:hypothetical protein
MKQKKTLLLLSLLFIFGAIVYYFEVYKENLKQQAVRQNALIVRAPTETIVKIAFANSYDEFEMLKSDEVWVLTKPIQDFADRFVIHRLLEFFSKQTYLQDLTKEENPEKNFQFKAQDQWIKVTDKSDVVYKIWLSDLVGLQGATYLKLQVLDKDKEENFYYLAAPEWRGELDRTLLYFRDKFVFRQDMNPLQAIEKWHNNKKIYEVKNLGDEKWQWKAEKQVEIDKEKIYEIIQELVQLSAGDFIDVKSLTKEKRKQIGFDKPLPSFKLLLKTANEEKWIEIKYSTSNVHKTYIQVDQQIYEIFANALGFLSWNLDDYKNRQKPFKHTITDIKEIQYSVADKQQSYVKDGEKWQGGIPGNRLLRILNEQKVVRYLPEALPPRFDSYLTLVDNNGIITKISWASSQLQDKQILMTSSRINETFLVEGDEWKKLLSVLEGESTWDSTSK